MSGPRPAPEARFDPLRGRWVIVAPGRSDRPHGQGAGAAGTPGAPPADCPLCPGHEAATPPEVARTGPGRPGEPGWRVRVVPNRYPIVAAGTGPSGGDGLRRRAPARGDHEVVVLSPDHGRSLARLGDAEVAEVLLVLRDRARVHAGRGRAACQVFVNHGPEAGASLGHPHAQLVATEWAPQDLVDEAARIGDGPGCVVCAEMERHRAEPALVVSSGEAELWCPWWSGTSYELLLAPRRHRARFEDAGTEVPAVGAALRDGLARLDSLLGDPPYNLGVHSRPAGAGGGGHWHVHVWPRVQRDAGFERATGTLVTTVDPADAAARLRRSRS